jgi:hypothetical protein
VGKGAYHARHNLLHTQLSWNLDPLYTSLQPERTRNMGQRDNPTLIGTLKYKSKAELYQVPLILSHSLGNAHGVFHVYPGVKTRWLQRGKAQSNLRWHALMLLLLKHMEKDRRTSSTVLHQSEGTPPAEAVIFTMLSIDHRIWTMLGPAASISPSAGQLCMVIHFSADVLPPKYRT